MPHNAITFTNGRVKSNCYIYVTGLVETALYISKSDVKRENLLPKLSQSIEIYELINPWPMPKFFPLINQILKFRIEITLNHNRSPPTPQIRARLTFRRRPGCRKQALNHNQMNLAARQEIQFITYGSKFVYPHQFRLSNHQLEWLPKPPTYTFDSPKIMARPKGRSSHLFPMDFQFSILS